MFEKVSCFEAATKAGTRLRTRGVMGCNSKRSDYYKQVAKKTAKTTRSNAHGSQKSRRKLRHFNHRGKLGALIPS
jgi:hypothetical protein